MRLFVGVWPTDDVTGVLRALPRPDVPGVRWTEPRTWHVTLAFLGDVDGEDRDRWEAALDDAGSDLGGPLEAVVGPATERLGPGVLSVPVAGLEAAARAVRAAGRAAGLDRYLDPRPFRGHLTLARGRGRAKIPARVAGTPLEARWAVGELCLVASLPERAGPPRYETLASTPLG